MTTVKKGTGKSYEKSRDEARTRREPPPRNDFRDELKELIAIPNIATRLKVPHKRDKRMGPNKDAWCEFTRSMATLYAIV